jgi:Ni/Fe-hydrogenase subunit HybB-like protein
LLAAILLIRARARQSVLLLLVGSGLAVAGLVANRWHTTMLAFTEPLSTSPAVTDPLVANYTPAWTEWATTFGVIGILTLAFSLGMRYLPAFKDLRESAHAHDDEHVPMHATEGDLVPAGMD